MAVSKKYFGTDGIRGRVGIPPITPDFIMRLGWAAGRVMAGDGGRVLIGKDTRVSGYMFESALEAGLAAAGADVGLLGPMPTPAISYLTRSTRARAGVIISASHNPYQDNGIKFFGGDGYKLSDETELAIEAELQSPDQLAVVKRIGKASRIVDAPRRYKEFCKSLFVGGPYLDGMKLAIDCAHGSTYHIAPDLFEELGASVTSLGVQPDGLNINLDSGATAPENLQRKTTAIGADAGLAFDGDGDRLIMVDSQGKVLDGDDILYILADATRDNLNGTVVGTIFSSLSLESSLRPIGLRLHRTAVGDRHVIAALNDHNLKLGGETSGHIVHMDYTPTGDGIIAALQVLMVMSVSGKSLAELHAGIKKCPRRLTSIPFPGGHEDCMDRVRQAVGEAEQELAAIGGRVILHPSGTEPLVRLLIEASSDQQVERMSDQLTSRVRDLLGVEPNA